MGKTMVDVARAAGVSQATVSRVINNPQEVSEDLVRQVHEAMSKLNYRPPTRHQRKAQARVKKRHAGLVALLQFDDYHLAHADVLVRALHGIEEALAEYGIGFVLARATHPEELPSCFGNGQIMGVLLDGVEPNRAIMEQIRAIPHIWLSSYRDEQGDHALVGNAAISRMAARYLAKRGHRHVGFVSCCGSFPVVQARAEAFRFAAAGMQLEAELFVDERMPDARNNSYLPLEKLEALLEAQVERMLAARPRITGLFVPHDLMTARMYRILQRRGVVAGRDVEIISCGNQMSALAGLYPCPATIDVGSEIIGRHAVEQLLRHIEHPGETSRVRLVVEPVLIPGDPVDPPKFGD